MSRMYDFYLGGSHNFEVDREAARKAMEFMPGLPKIMQANRAFMRRAVHYATAQGISQFLDIGSGIPTFGNVHEVAQTADPAAKVAYVDHDPVAVAHSQAVLEGVGNAVIAAADLRHPQDILKDPVITGLLDFDRPVALLLVAVLHFVEDADEPYAAVAELREALAPGSLLIMTHASYEGIPLSQEQAGGTVDVYRTIRNPLIMRSRAEVSRFFEGYEMVDPGLVSMPEWRPDAPVGEDQEDPFAFSGFAGVGRKA
ncbi:SAM-dependent methyltransferase [Streptomyces fulvorobeus]|uniref:SAM-dependent methyltransferase n=1 Tax=Streptomyces fulvorobeus TaxID=284028 RepID=A0A7Y9KYN4_9ACTN|nr:SAM-dependent methyltransferase [Streptomyces fulvorobeus]